MEAGWIGSYEVANVWGLYNLLFDSVRMYGGDGIIIHSINILHNVTVMLHMLSCRH